MRKYITDRGLYFTVYSFGKQHPVLTHPVTYISEDVNYIKRRYLRLTLKTRCKEYCTTLTVEQLKSINDLKLIVDSLVPPETRPIPRYTEVKLSKRSLNNIIKSL